MGYDVHVTRAADWIDSAASPIGLDEWLALVASDPELRLDGEATARTGDGGVLRYESSGLAVWTAHPRQEPDNPAWIDHQEGRLVVKNPDTAFLRKLHRLAVVLGAKVVGDEGEEYDADGNVKEDEPAPPASPPSGRPWWRRLFGG